MKAPSFICRDRHGGFLFRRVVPKNIRHKLGGRRELRLSLKTHHRPTAIIRARKYAMASDELYEKLADITWEITQTEEELTKFTAEAKEATDSADSGIETLKPILNPKDDEPPPNPAMMEVIYAAMGAILSRMELSEDRKRQAAITQQKIVTLKKIQAQISAKLAQDEVTSAFNWDLSEFEATSTTNPTDPPSSSLPSIPLSQLWQDYTQEHASKWAEGTKAENNEAFRMFTEVVGNITTSDLTIDVARSYKRELTDYPPRRNVGGNAKKSLKELREQSDKRISQATVANRMGLINGFWEWARRHEYIDTNPLAEIVIKRDKSKRDRDPFTPDDLQLIFSQPRFTQGKYKKDWEFWLPLLALYTGCRMGELCQLTGNDIIEKNGVTAFRIHDEANNKLKTNNSIRTIPIHQHLIKIGLMELVERRGKGPLFDLEPVNGKLSHYPSKRFGTFKSKLGFTARKTFHSFRHTFRDTLSDADVRDSLVSALMGHSDESISFRKYGSEATIGQLNDAIQRLDYYDVLSKVSTTNATT